MTEKVVSIGGAPLPGEPVPEVLVILRGMLAEAEQGNVRSLALTWTDSGRSIFTNWHSDNDYFALMGGAGFLHHRLMLGVKTD
jgi:hypothetical protein